MTYQGERAHTIASESRRNFAVSKVRIDADGQVRDVLWTEVSGRSDQDVGAPVVAPVADVVDAIQDGAQVAALFSSSKGRLPERVFVVLKKDDGREYIAFDNSPSPGRNLADMAKLDDGAGHAVPPTGRKMSTFAVSKVRLDADGRVIAMLWGRVDTGKNAWATPEVEAPVTQAVDALDAGDQVFGRTPPS